MESVSCKVRRRVRGPSRCSRGLRRKLRRHRLVLLPLADRVNAAKLLAHAARRLQICVKHHRHARAERLDARRWRHRRVAKHADVVTVRAVRVENRSKQQQVEYYLPAWHATFAIAQPGGVMCATSAVNGVDSCMNPTYLQGFLRDTFNFSGFVITDGNSCGNTNCQRTVAMTKPQCANNTAWTTAPCGRAAAFGEAACGADRRHEARPHARRPEGVAACAAPLGHGGEPGGGGS